MNSLARSQIALRQAVGADRSRNVRQTMGTIDRWTVAFVLFVIVAAGVVIQAL